MDLGSVITDCGVKHYNMGLASWDLGWYCAKGVPVPRSIVTDHYLLDPEGVLIPDSLGPANNYLLDSISAQSHMRAGCEESPANNLWKLKGVHILQLAFPWTLPVTRKGRDLEFGRLLVRARKAAGLIWKKKATSFRPQATLDSWSRIW